MEFIRDSAYKLYVEYMEFIVKVYIDRNPFDMNFKTKIAVTIKKRVTQQTTSVSLKRCIYQPSNLMVA